MNDSPLRERMMERLLAAQTPWGRCQLNAYVKWKRMAWQWSSAAPTSSSAPSISSSASSPSSCSHPVFLVIAILVKLDGGPIFFKQTRIGFMGREFKMIKYRSMVVDAEARLKDLLAKNEKASGVTFKMKDDPRITRIGRFIRKSSLDELPQFWNVLKGEMSLVGPRPPIPREVALYTQADRRRFSPNPASRASGRSANARDASSNRQSQQHRLPRTGRPRCPLHREPEHLEGPLDPRENRARDLVWQRHVTQG
jgi:hypothetical protein